MAETLILIRASTHELDHAAVEAYYVSTSAALRGFQGYLGGGLWHDTLDPHSRLILYSYESVEASEKALKSFSHVRPLIEAQHVARRPADVVRIEVLSSEGALRGHLDMAKYVSVSQRVAEPGYSEELIEELHEIFAELRFIEGYLGSLVGVHDTLREEAFGFVAWSSPAAFSESLPNRIPYQVRLFEKTL